MHFPFYQVMAESPEVDTSSLDSCPSGGVSSEHVPSHEPKQISASNGKKKRFVGARKGGGKVNTCVQCLSMFW